jgi:flagellar motility protein MotE (MotC chaperone)
MPEYRASFNEIEEGVATFALYKDEEFQEHLRYAVEDLPDGVDSTQLDDQFRPEFEDGEVVALHYDQELTEQKHEEFDEGDERYRQLLDDS